MEKKAVDYTIKSRSLNSQTVPAFNQEIKDLLDEGWDVLSSQSIGLDTGGGVSGGGNIMVFVTLVKYGYFNVVETPPAVNEPASG